MRRDDGADLAHFHGKSDRFDLGHRLALLHESQIDLAVFTAVFAGCEFEVFSREDLTAQFPQGEVGLPRCLVAGRLDEDLAHTDLFGAHVSREICPVIGLEFFVGGVDRQLQLGLEETIDDHAALKLLEDDTAISGVKAGIVVKLLFVTVLSLDLFEAGFRHLVGHLTVALYGLLLEEGAVNDIVPRVGPEFGVAVTTDDLAHALVVLFDGFEFVLEDLVSDVFAINDEGHRRRWRTFPFPANASVEKGRAETRCGPPLAGPWVRIVVD